MLKQFLKKTKKGARILVLTHAGCDVDALASAATILFTFGKDYKIQIGVPEHINLNAKALAQNLKIPFTINPQNISDFDVLILVDFNSFKMLGKLEQEVKEFKKPIFLIDHHTNSGEKITPNAIIQPNAVATVEILFGLLKKDKTKITPKVAECIAAGIITDSASFLIADSETFSIMAEAMKIAKKSLSEIFLLFQLEENFSEKIAKLKAARRVRIFKVNDSIVATTTVSCFEADAASVLSRLGADIAFAGDVDNSKLKISGRANPAFVRKNSFDLARDIFEPLEKHFSGSGGGHAGAAAFNGTAESIDLALQKCVELVQGFFKKKSGYAETKEYK